MEIYNPAFIKIKELLWDTLIEFIGKHWYAVGSDDINKHIMQLKKKDEKKYSLISFTYMYPYSDQVQDVLVDMIRHCIVDQADKGYILTVLGKNIYNKKFKK